MGFMAITSFLIFLCSLTLPCSFGKTLPFPVGLQPQRGILQRIAGAPNCPPHHRFVIKIAEGGELNLRPLLITALREHGASREQCIRCRFSTALQAYLPKVNAFGS